MHVKDALGRVKECRSGRVQLDEGSSLEVTGEYQLRRKEKELVITSLMEVNTINLLLSQFTVTASTYQRSFSYL